MISRKNSLLVPTATYGYLKLRTRARIEWLKGGQRYVQEDAESESVERGRQKTRVKG